MIEKGITYMIKDKRLGELNVQVIDRIGDTIYYENNIYELKGKCHITTFVEQLKKDM